MKSIRRRRPAFRKSGMVLRLVKSSLVGCVITIVFILLFALILKWEWLGENSIPLATSIIKAVCAGFVGFLCANGVDKRAWLWAGGGGVAYITLAFLAFSLVEKNFAVSVALLADLGMGFVAGAAGSMLLQLKAPA